MATRRGNELERREEPQEALAPTGVGAEAVISREQAQVQAAIIAARRWPRDAGASREAMLVSARRPSFADHALYSYRRAGTLIEGPSVNLARDAARCWGNLQFGYAVLERTPATTTLEGFCWDLETNTRKTVQVSFMNLIQRKGGWREPDEREYRELLGKQGALAERNAILQVLPVDIREDFIQECRDTIEAASRKDPDRAKKVEQAFASLGVTREKLEAFLKTELEKLSPAQHRTLKGMFAAIRDGEAKVEEYFPEEEKLEPVATGTAPGTTPPPAGAITTEQRLANLGEKLGRD